MKDTKKNTKKTNDKKKDKWQDRLEKLHLDEVHLMGPC
jgi:hypothetical protein